MEKSTQFRLITPGNSNLATAGFLEHSSTRESPAQVQGHENAMCSPSTFPCSQCSSVPAAIYWVGEKTSVQFVVYSRECNCEVVRGRGGVGSLGDHLPGVKSHCSGGSAPRHTCCTGSVLSKFCRHGEAIYFYFSNT